MRSVRTIPNTSYKGYCISCGSEESFRSVHSGTTNSDKRLYRVLRCIRCSDVRFSIEQKHDVHGDTWFEAIISYPPAPFMDRPAWMGQLKSDYQEILQSAYKALDHHLFMLSSIGFRTVLDKIICAQIGDIGTFAQKTEQLVKLGVVDADRKEVLDTVIEAGNASAHRGFNPDEILARDIATLAEHVIYKIEVERLHLTTLKTKASDLKNKTPKRPKP
jgi:hypothetical protein